MKYTVYIFMYLTKRFKLYVKFNLFEFTLKELKCMQKRKLYYNFLLGGLYYFKAKNKVTTDTLINPNLLLLIKLTVWYPQFNMSN